MLEKIIDDINFNSIDQKDVTVVFQLNASLLISM